MIPGLNDIIAPDMQKILFFLIPALIALAALTLTLSRGSSIPGIVTTITFALIAFYFAPGFIELF
ncbi:MAG: hypothetical protein ABJ239_05285 [Erythrobacter sp.]